MDKTKDKRRLGRKFFSNPILLEFNDPDSGSSRPVRLEASGIDINSNGIGLLAAKPINPGGVVKLYLPFGDPPTMIPTFSEVRWMRPSAGSYRIGLFYII
jgi:hypothetical protein